MYPLEQFHIYFSPYTAHVLEKDGVLYPTLEHAYHCLRYDNVDIIKEIILARSPMLAWHISQKYKQFQVPTFSERKVEVMRELIQLKVAQHEDVRKALLSSGDVKIIKRITTGPKADGFWDDGEDGEGLNHVGKLWMEVREGLREE